MHARKSFCQLWSKMYIFAKKHISFKTMLCIYRDILILNSCVWLLIPRNVASFRKRNTLNACMRYYNCTDFWSTFDEFWLLNEHHTICFLSHISDDCIIRNKHKRFEKNLHSSATRISRKPPEAIGSQVKYIYFASITKHFFDFTFTVYTYLSIHIIYPHF